MSSPAWNRRRASQRRKTRTRKLRRLARHLRLVGWHVWWMPSAHHAHSHHEHGLAVDVSRTVQETT